jgi:hypothetical protein
MFFKVFGVEHIFAIRFTTNNYRLVMACAISEQFRVLAFLIKNPPEQFCRALAVTPASRGLLLSFPR